MQGLIRSEPPIPHTCSHHTHILPPTYMLYLHADSYILPHIHVCSHIYTFKHIYTFRVTYIQTYTYIYMCTSVHTHQKTHPLIWSIYIHHTYTKTHTHMHILTDPHLHSHSHIHIANIHTVLHTFAFTRILSHAETHT